MLPPTSYVVGCGYEIDLPPPKPEPVNHPTGVALAIGCGHRVLLLDERMGVSAVLHQGPGDATPTSIITVR